LFGVSGFECLIEVVLIEVVYYEVQLCGDSGSYDHTAGNLKYQPSSNPVLHKLQIALNVIPGGFVV